MKFIRSLIGSLLRPLRAFWHDRGRRRTALWVLGTLSLAVLAFGAYTFVDAQRDYSRLSEKIDKYPHDLRQSDMDTYELQLLGLYHRQRDTAEAHRGRGIMFLGIGLTGLALAYLVAPGAEPDADVPSFARDEIAAEPPGEPPAT